MTGMNTNRPLRGLTLVAIAGLIFAGGAAAHDGPHDVVHKGEPFAIAQGAAYTWIVTDPQNRPTAIGVSISAETISSVSGTHSINVSMPLPEKEGISGLAFDHVYLNWNEHGHPPADLFGAPHFDVHFFMTDAAAREAISPADPGFMQKGAHYPSAEFVPAGYAPPPAPDPVPQMGFHLTDMASDIFAGKPFTEVFIYGGWDGKITFLEPMITLAMLESRETVVREIKQPARYLNPGYYPTQYRIAYDEVRAEHQVVLENFIWRD